MLRNKYFQDVLKQDVRTQGIAESIMKASYGKLLETRNKKMLRPRVLLPVNYHFCGVKGTDLLGLGTKSLAFYGLDKNFDIDEESLRKTIKSVYDAGDDIAYSLAVAGDTMHGKVHDIKKLSDIITELSDDYKKPAVPIVVDAAGSYMFIGVMKDNKNYDGTMPEVSFNIKNVEAIVGDPHKQPLPYSCGLLMLKDWNLVNYTDVRNIAKINYLDMDNKDNQDTSAACATIPTSRSGANAFAVHAYLKYMGLSGLKKEKENIWSLVNDFRNYVTESKNYELVCEPQTQVVSFRFKGSGEDNVSIYKNIKNSDKDFCYISHDDGMLVRTEDQLKSEDKKYAGLFATIMEHNNLVHMNKLKERLEEEAYLIGHKK
jgi:glutamate/tyrosine decarboxylase-like PLP-dependent enzyme